MSASDHPTRDEARQLAAEDRAVRQLSRLNQMLERVLPNNRFYDQKFSGVELPIRSLAQFAEFPMTTKSELELAFQDDPYANLTHPFQDYVRVHRTSGTSGTPLYVYDTHDDWKWWIEVWQFVLDAANLVAGDRALMAFSFGPFIGFWSAADALLHRGVQLIPTGGMTTSARLQMMSHCQATIVCCTPTYALRMAEVARSEGFDLRSVGVRQLIVAGEPGGSLPHVRHRIESAWDASVLDHAGASEIGPWGYGDPGGTGMFVNESDFIAELLPHGEGHEGLSELVLTGLGRIGWPLIRYRTGDLVRRRPSPTKQDTNLFLGGGILGRADDMIVIRGVNIFPSSIENVLRSLDAAGEFRVTAKRVGEMDQLEVEVESGDNDQLATDVANALNLQLGLRVNVRPRPIGSLPRSEAKSKRFIDERTAK